MKHMDTAGTSHMMGRGYTISTVFLSARNTGS